MDDGERQPKGGRRKGGGIREKWGEWGERRGGKGENCCGTVKFERKALISLNILFYLLNFVA